MGLSCLKIHGKIRNGLVSDNFYHGPDFSVPTHFSCFFQILFPHREGLSGSFPPISDLSSREERFFSKNSNTKFYRRAVGNMIFKYHNNHFSTKKISQKYQLEGRDESPGIGYLRCCNCKEWFKDAAALTRHTKQLIQCNLCMKTTPGTEF